MWGTMMCLCFVACSDRIASLGAKWGQGRVGARKGGSSSVRWLSLRPKELERDTVSPEAPARAPFPPGTGPTGTWQAAALLGPSLCLGSSMSSLRPQRLTPRAVLTGLKAQLGVGGYVTT